MVHTLLRKFTPIVIANNIVQYAGAVRIYLYEGLLYSYDRATDSEVSVFFWLDHSSLDFVGAISLLR
jgi:hypothetical protein